MKAELLTCVYVRAIFCLALCGVDGLRRLFPTLAKVIEKAPGRKFYAAELAHGLPGLDTTAHSRLEVNGPPKWLGLSDSAAAPPATFGA